MTNNLTDMIFNDNFYVECRSSKFKYVVRTDCVEVNTLFEHLYNIIDLHFTVKYYIQFNIHEH